MNALLAEFLGTLLFVLVGVTSVCSAPYFSADQVTQVIMIATTNGIGLWVVIFLFGPYSGAYVNPAVTLGVISAKQKNRKIFFPYLAAQTIGAVSGTFLLYLILPRELAEFTKIGLPHLAPSIGQLGGIIIETVITFTLVLTVLLASRMKEPFFAAMVIGAVLGFLILIFGAVTGAIMNPVRAFGPAMIATIFLDTSASLSPWRDQLVYWIGPFLGGVIAGGTFYIPCVKHHITSKK